MFDFSSWAASFIGKQMKQPRGGQTGTVTSFTIGKRRRGVWFELDNGSIASVYRQPGSKAYKQVRA